MSAAEAPPGPATPPSSAGSGVVGASGLHESAAALLVRQYLGDTGDATSPSTPTAGGAFRRKQSRGSGQFDNLPQYLVRHDAARRIQKSFRRYQTEQSLRRRSFGKFGEEALELIRRYTATDGSLQEESFASKARLILHFDVNKTIIMTDKAQDGDHDFIINALLSDCAWGRLEPGPVWVPVGRLATDRPAIDVQLMTYRSYLDSFLLPFEPGRSPAAQRRNSELKARRQALKRTFTQPGQPGHMFRGVFDKLKEALVPPAGQGEREIHILPSFFNLLIHLQKQAREFTIVFRSFGEDLPAVAAEMNLFCTGQHPQYPDVRMDGSDGRTDLRVAAADSAGVFHRASTKPDGSALLVGPVELLGSFARKRPTRGDLEAAAAAGRGRLLTCFADIQEHFQQAAAQGNRAFAVQDYYPFWKSRNERSHAGKLFLLDPANRDTLEVFFDDNVGYTTAHIVDVRDVATGAPIAFADAVGRHLLKVEPLNATLDGHYFTRGLHECVMAWLRAHSRRGQEQRLPRADPGREGGANSRAAAVAHTSRRGRDLWAVLQTRLVALIRLRHALEEQS